MSRLAVANPARHELRRRLLGIAWLYVGAAGVASLLGLTFGTRPPFLSRYDDQVELPAELASLFSRSERTKEPGPSPAEAVRSHPVVSFRLVLGGHARMVEDPASGGERVRWLGTPDAATLRALEEALTAEPLEREMRLVLALGSLPQRHKVLDILERLEGAAVRRLLEFAVQDRVPEISARAARLQASGPR